MNPNDVIIKYMPDITEDQLWDFYVRNGICEVGYGKATAVIPLKYNPYMVCAFYQDKLVRIIRATFDGLRKLGNTFTCAYIVEKLEEEVYQSIGLEHNSGHLVYYKDERPYVRKSI